MNVRIPDCYAVDDLLVFGDITHGVICQGIEVCIPDQSNTEVDVLSALESDLRTFLANLQEGERLQIQFYKDSDYQRELERFQKVTEKGNMCRFSGRHRTERYERYSQRMAESRLIQSNLQFYISSRIRGAKFRGGLSRRAHYERTITAYKQSFDQRIQVGDQLFEELRRRYENFGCCRPIARAVTVLRSCSLEIISS